MRLLPPTILLLISHIVTVSSRPLTPPVPRVLNPALALSNSTSEVSIATSATYTSLIVYNPSGTASTPTLPSASASASTSSDTVSIPTPLNAENESAQSSSAALRSEGSGSSTSTSTSGSTQVQAVDHTQSSGSAIISSSTSTKTSGGRRSTGISGDGPSGVLWSVMTIGSAILVTLTISGVVGMEVMI